MRVAGLDVGERTIGVAVSDPLGLTAQGIGVVRRTRLAADLAELGRLLAPYGITALVVGLPRNMDGSVGPQAERVRSFAEIAARSLAVPLCYWDERLSTREAERTLIAADLSRRRRRQVVDKVAAVVILQGYLDRKRSQDQQA